MTTIVARVLLVLVIAGMAGAAAIVFSAAQPREYQADMRFEYSRLVSPELQFLGPNFIEPQIDENVRIQTEAAEVNSFDVALATAKAAPSLGNVGQISARVAAQPIRDTLVVVLTARASTPQRAARLASTYGRQYLALRRAREAKRGAAAQRVLETRLAELRPDQTRGVQGAGLRDQINTLEILRRIGSGSPQILQNARASFAATSPNTLRNVLFAVLFGIAVGVGLVALRAEGRGRGGVTGARRAFPVAGSDASRET